MKGLLLEGAKLTSLLLQRLTNKVVSLDNGFFICFLCQPVKQILLLIISCVTATHSYSSRMGKPCRHSEQWVKK